jgi:uncharacterized membrane protein YhaH (DUF805 family)
MKTIVGIYFGLIAIMLFILFAVGRFNFMRHLPDFIWPQNPDYWYGQVQFVHMNLMFLAFIGLLAIGPRFGHFYMRTKDEQKSNVHLLFFMIGWYMVFVVTFPVVAHYCGY